MRQVIAILFGASFTLAACWSAGKLLLGRWKLEVYSEELQLFRFATGSALFSLFILILAALNLARLEVFLVLGALVIAGAFRVREQRVRLPDFPLAWKVIYALVLLGFGTFYFANALAPEVSPDGSSYHLGIVSRYLTQHGLGHITTSIYANLSEGLEMLFLPAFSIGRHSATSLIEFAFFVGIPFAILFYARRNGFAKAGVAAAAIVFCSSVFGVAGTSAYNDAAAVFTLFCLFYVLQIWDETRQPALLAVAGILAGFSYGIKYTLFLAAPYAVCFVAWKLIRARKPIFRPLATVCACALILMAPWWVKNWITVQNPLSPFANSLFPNPYVSPKFERDYIRSQSSQVPAQDRFIEATIRGGSSGGFLGPLFLLAPLGLLALRYRQGRQVLLAAAIFVIPALANVQTRFLMLAAPFFALAIAFAVMRARSALLAITFAAPLLAIPSVADGYCDSWAWRLHTAPFRDAFRLIPERESLKKRLDGFTTVELINNNVPPNGLVYAADVPKEAYLTKNYMVGYESSLGENLMDALYVAMNPDFYPTWIQTFRFPVGRYTRLRLVENSQGKDDDEWRIGEIRLFNAGVEIPRGEHWTVLSNANRWDVALLLDGNPATRWRSRMTPFPGISIELDLGGPVAIDTVELDCSHDEYAMRPKLEALDSAGHWSTLAATPLLSDRLAPTGMRRAAVQQFKQHGITHILLNKNDYVAPDFQKNTADWGVALVGVAGDDWLYEIK